MSQITRDMLTDGEWADMQRLFVVLRRVRALIQVKEVADDTHC